MNAEAWSLLPLGILLAHLFGDYVFQNNYLAQRKTSSSYVAYQHALIYMLTYQIMLIAVISIGFRPAHHGSSSAQPATILLYLLGILVIGGTPLVIDRWRLVKHLIWLVNQLAPREFRYTHREAMANQGYSERTPVWMRTWLMIIVDNSIHLLINVLAIYLLILPGLGR